MINPNKQLICELTEKLTQKFLQLNQNDFSKLIQNMCMVADEKLILET
jgi:hypothetical protein